MNKEKEPGGYLLPTNLTLEIIELFTIFRITKYNLIENCKNRIKIVNKRSFKTSYKCKHKKRFNRLCKCEYGSCPIL